MRLIQKLYFLLPKKIVEAHFILLFNFLYRLVHCIQKGFGVACLSCVYIGDVKRDFVPYLLTLANRNDPIHRHPSTIDCLSFVMCLLLAPLVIVFFSFLFVAVIYSTNEANKAGGTRH